jgi:alginate O-acetyltransferase complex protein AlgI
MVFASPIFLFLFCRSSSLLCSRSRGAAQRVLLVEARVLRMGEAPYLVLVIGSVLFNYAIGAAIGRAQDPRMRKRWLAAGVVGNLAVLAVFKYANFAVGNVNALAPILAITPLAVASIPLPLGISFFTFHAISYVVDVYKRNADAERNLPRFALYILLFPQLIAGPIIRWRDIAAQLPDRPQRIADFTYGVRRFVLGLGKKVLIANTLGQTADQIFSLPGGELTTPLAWLGLVCYTLQIYFDFSGYSDMAIGLMRMFGFRILENFNYPYISRSIREFGGISIELVPRLSLPLGGNQRGERRAPANLVIVFCFTLWRGRADRSCWGRHGAFLVAGARGSTVCYTDRTGRPRVRASRGDGRMGAVPLRTLAQALGHFARSRASPPATRCAIRSSVPEPLSSRCCSSASSSRRRSPVASAAGAIASRMGAAPARRWRSGRMPRGSAPCSCFPPRSLRPVPTTRSSTSASKMGPLPRSRRSPPPVSSWRAGQIPGSQRASARERD